MKNKTIAISGGVAPIHCGHLYMIKDARKYADTVIFIVNNDNWLINKHGYSFMPEDDRLEIIKNIKGVDDAFLTSHILGDKDKSVCRELRSLMPDIFGNGGDRREDIPEFALCKELGIKMIFDVGGGKVQSSSWLIDEAIKNRREITKELQRITTF